MKTKRISKLELKNKLFFQFPKFLMLDDNYRKLTNDSKVLYVLYYERSRLSLKNNWVDDNNFVYIKYKNEKAMEILNCRSEKLSKIKKELKKYGLIDEVRQGKNKPNIIYVLEPTLSNIDVDEFNDLEASEIHGYSKIEYPDIRKSNTGNSKIECQDVRKSNKSNNDLNNNDLSIKEECENFSHDSDEIKLSKLLFKKMKENNDKAKEPDYQKWAEHIDKLMRLDKYSADEITKMIEFCQSDHFWKSNILSTKKLREKAGTLIIQMNRNKNNSLDDFINEPKKTKITTVDIETGEFIVKEI